MKRNFFIGTNNPTFIGVESTFAKTYELKKFYMLSCSHPLGGSGIGKGTMLKNFADFFEQHGYEIDQFWCSGDPKNSLDAVMVKNAGIGFITAYGPHAKAQIGSEIEEIIDFAQFIKPIDQKEIKEKQKLIKKITDEREIYIVEGAKWLSKLIDKRDKQQKPNSLEVEHIYKECSEILTSRGINSMVDRTKTVYARSFTSVGILDNREKLFHKNIFKLHCDEETANAVFQKLQKRYGGYAFLHFLIRGRLEGLMIDNQLFIQDKLMEKPIDINCVKKAANALYMANAIHGKKEAILKGYVDFDKVNIFRNKILRYYK